MRQKTPAQRTTFLQELGKADEDAREELLSLLAVADDQITLGSSDAAETRDPGDEMKALDWLRRSVESGFSDADSLKEDAHLASLHDDPDFDALVLLIDARHGAGVRWGYSAAMTSLKR